MATYIGTNNVNAIYHGSTPLTGVYRGVTQITTTATTTPDQYFSDVVLLLQDSLTDESPQGQTITALGGASFTTTNPKVGTRSLSLLAAGDSVVLPSAETASLGAGDFTFEAWIYIPSLSGIHTIYDARTSGAIPPDQDPAEQPVIAIDSLGRLNVEAGGVLILISDDYSPVASSTWTHIALVRSGIYTDAYINGVSRARALRTGPFSVGTSGVRIGGTHSNTNHFLGYLDAFRITKGVARYLAPFTPPTSAFPATNGDPDFANVVLLLQDSLTDESPQGQTLVSTGAQVTTSVVKYGAGSLEFTGGYLTNSGTNLAFGGGDFTLEFWLYMNPSAAIQRFIWDARGGTNAGDRPVIWVQSSEIDGYRMSFYATGYRLDSNPALSLTTWHHVALVRSGGISKWYIDGQDETGTLIGTEQSWTVNSQTVIGESTGASSPLSGYIDDLRLTIGIARYTSNFTPPTAAFPN